MATYSHPKTQNQRAASSVDEFCAASGISRSTFYKEVRGGRLTIRKVGRKTVVLAQDGAAWLAALPVVKAREAA